MFLGSTTRIGGRGILRTTGLNRSTLARSAPRDCQRFAKAAISRLLQERFESRSKAAGNLVGFGH